MTSPEKAAAFRDLLNQGLVSLLIDATQPGVSVPPILAGNPSLILQYGLNTPIPIPDLQVDADGVRATLSFNLTPMATYVPWHAIYGAAGDGFLFAILDEELFAAIDATSAIKPAVSIIMPQAKPRPRLTSVPADAAAADDNARPAAAAPTLRVVK